MKNDRANRCSCWANFRANIRLKGTRKPQRATWISAWGSRPQAPVAASQPTQSVLFCSVLFCFIQVRSTGMIYLRAIRPTSHEVLPTQHLAVPHWTRNQHADLQYSGGHYRCGAYGSLLSGAPHPPAAVGGVLCCMRDVGFCCKEGDCVNER